MIPKLLNYGTKVLIDKQEIEEFKGSRMKTSLPRSCQLSMFRELCRLAAPKLGRLATRREDAYLFNCHSGLLVSVRRLAPLFARGKG